MRKTVLCGILAVATAALAQQGQGGGPWWQSEDSAALHNQVRAKQWELNSLQSVAPADPAALAAKQVEVNALRQELFAKRTAERPAWCTGAGSGTCDLGPCGGAGGGSGDGRGAGRGMGRGGGAGRQGGRGACPWAAAPAPAAPAD